MMFSIVNKWSTISVQPHTSPYKMISSRFLYPTRRNIHFKIFCVSEVLMLVRIAIMFTLPKFSTFILVIRCGDIFFQLIIKISICNFSDMISKFKLERRKGRIYFEDVLCGKLCHGPLPNEWQMHDECYLIVCTIILWSAWKPEVWP